MISFSTGPRRFTAARESCFRSGRWTTPPFATPAGSALAESESFEKFACVGGIPKYWEFVEAGQDAVALAESLYFDLAPYMEQEPQRILRDEGVTGLNALAVLEAVGRGAERPSEIASRLGTAQTNLSRLLQQLLDASVLTRELPFGESVRSTKKILYRIADPTMRFWFRVYSPHQTLWRTYAAEQKRKLIHDHAATVFEDFCRARFSGAQRYWERGVELDFVAPDPEDPPVSSWRRSSGGICPSRNAKTSSGNWRANGLAARYAPSIPGCDSKYSTPLCWPLK